MPKNIPVHDSATRLHLAIEEIRKNPGISPREIARIYRVPRSTLQASFQGRRDAKTSHEATQRLSVEEEQGLITWIDRMTAWGWPPSIQHLEGMTKSLLEAKGDSKPLGHHWYKTIMNRHPQFKTKFKRNLDQSRKDASHPCNGSTMGGADGRTYSEHSRSPSYSRIEVGLRTKYCAFWSGGQVAQW